MAPVSIASPEHARKPSMPRRNTAESGLSSCAYGRGGVYLCETTIHGSACPRARCPLDSFDRRIVPSGSRQGTNTSSTTSSWPPALSLPHFSHPLGIRSRFGCPVIWRLPHKPPHRLTKLIPSQQGHVDRPSAGLINEFGQTGKASQGPGAPSGSQVVAPDAGEAVDTARTGRHRGNQRRDSVKTPCPAHLCCKLLQSPRPAALPEPSHVVGVTCVTPRFPRLTSLPATSELGHGQPLVAAGADLPAERIVSGALFTRCR